MKKLFFIILSCFITSAVFAQRECGAIFPTNVNISLTNMIKGSYIIRLIIEGQVVQVSNLLIK